MSMKLSQSLSRYIDLLRLNSFSTFGYSVVADVLLSRQQLALGRPLIPSIDRREFGFRKVGGIQHALASWWLQKIGVCSTASSRTYAVASENSRPNTSEANVKNDSAVGSNDNDPSLKEISNAGIQQQGTQNNEGKSGKPRKPTKSPKAAKGADSSKTTSGTGNANSKDEAQADIRRIELRIGRIVDVYKHPEADSLYVERVDVGDPNGRLRTVVSGLVRHVQQEELRGRLAIFMTNIKPVKLRGVLSEAMLLCATSNESSVVEVLAVPKDCQPGDRVYATGFEDGKPDVELNLKRGVWPDLVKPALRTDAKGVACFRDSPLRVRSRDGSISSQVKNAQIS